MSSESSSNEIKQQISSMMTPVMADEINNAMKTMKWAPAFAENKNAEEEEKLLVELSLLTQHFDSLSMESLSRLRNKSIKEKTHPIVGTYLSLFSMSKMQGSFLNKAMAMASMNNKNEEKQIKNSERENDTT